MRKTIYNKNDDDIKTLDAAKKKVNTKTYSDIAKFIDFDNNQYLEEFPEYFAGYTPFATNTGLMCFYKEPTTEEPTPVLVVYDLTKVDTVETNEKEEKKIELDSISPDISFFIDYNYISTPLNIRKINYNKNGNFIADRFYKDSNNTYSFFNCDKVGDKEPNDSGYFETKSEASSIIYYYKPILYIRAYNNNGTENTTISLKIQDKNMIQKTESINDNSEKKTNIFYYDCSNFDIGTNLELTLKLEENNNTGGYLEVM